MSNQDMKQKIKEIFRQLKKASFLLRFHTITT